jgi:hypothetical protein
MRISDYVSCKSFPCADVNHEGYAVPQLDIPTDRVRIVLISEAAPTDPADGYYALGEPLFAQTTIAAFNDAGTQATTLQDILGLGIYFTTAVKCAKTGYGIATPTIKECSRLLERELALFPKVQAYLLMGDVAIKAVNYIAARAGESRVIPAGSTYKIRDAKYFFRGARAFPSYLQAGPSFFIEKSKRRMIAEDIASALSIVK